MLDIKNTQDWMFRIPTQNETLLGEVRTAVKKLDEALDSINFFEPHRHGTHANFHTFDAAMPDMSLGELINWVASFAYVDGPELDRQQPAEAALIKARARQLNAIIKPLAKRIDEICNDPSYNGYQPFLFRALAHPQVYWAFEELCSKLATLAR
jgi:hypothetical protein